MNNRKDFFEFNLRYELNARNSATTTAISATLIFIVVFGIIESAMFKVKLVTIFTAKTKLKKFFLLYFIIPKKIVSTIAVTSAVNPYALLKSKINGI